MDAVDEEDSSALVGEVGNGAEVVDGAEEVACSADGHEPCALGKERLEVAELQERIGSARVPELDFYAFLLEAQPGGDVGLVIEGGKDDLVAGAECFAQ